MDVAIIKFLETSFGIFDKSLVAGMLNSFKFNNQFIDFRFFNVNYEKLCKISYYCSYRSMVMAEST